MRTHAKSHAVERVVPEPEAKAQAAKPGVPKQILTFQQLHLELSRVTTKVQRPLSFETLHRAYRETAPPPTSEQIERPALINNYP
jgi:hypothetical protein